MKIRLRDGSGTIDLKYLYEDVDRYGNVRIYFRRKGARKVCLKQPIGSAEFIAEYKQAFAGKALEVAPSQGLIRARANAGTLRWLIERYYDESEDFSLLDTRTKHVRKMVLDAICSEPFSDENPTLMGSMDFAGMPPLAVRRLRDRKKGAPEAGNSRVKALRQVFKFGIAAQYCQHNPAREVSYIKTGSQGFHAWDIGEVRQFEAAHPVGTKARLALALLLFLGARRSDVVQFGKQHVRAAEHMPPALRDVHAGRWLQYTQHKNRKKKPVTLTLPILPELEEILGASPLGDLTWLVTAFGNGFTSAGFGNWFRDQCNKAGLRHCSAHGLRKAGATIAADNGASGHTLMAIFGWSTLKQAELYTRSADQKRLAASGMHLIGAGQKTNKSAQQS
ncbi:tyrosine-type recombinase/integrase [Bradyrhizobium erythrophlei]|uniref:Phage integrase family protein n=1 Tax=Bradyrhizobium erythrophlei TaxID=1437360 RepID=A0A1M5KQZ9_9BRAD|nr:site-specific integrase [Bradyrhizobium erythrophlei]SHG55110.1 Phage integrase family protein [Bradyrhizobium erythrophlei]